MPFVDVSDLQMYYEVHGPDDGIPLLNISGSGADLRRSFPDRNPLNRASRVVSFDQRGLGQTLDADRLDDDPWTMAQYADDAAAVIRQVGGSMGWTTCNVMGTSFGGMVALNLAARHPELIDKLVLNCTSPGGLAPSYPIHTLGDLDPGEAFATRMRIYDQRWDPQAAEPIPGLGPFYDAMVATARATRPPDVAAGLARQLAARAGHDVLDELPSMHHETLICAGRHDAMAPMENSELLAERLPNSTLKVFDGGHFFMLQDRAAYRAIDEFLTTVDT